MITRLFSIAALLMVPATAAVAAGPKESGIGTLRTFGDWVVGCDNLSTCTAVGFPQAEATGGPAYLRVTRRGEPDAVPQVKLVAVTDTVGNDAQKQDLTLSITGTKGAPGIDAVAANTEDGYASASIPKALPFLTALLPAEELVVASDAIAEPAHISLRGLSAALRAMDDRQGRADNVSALVARGALGPADMPALPEPPAPVQAVKLTELDPAPNPPEGIESASPECDNNRMPIAFQAVSGVRIFGSCVFEGAYNVGRHFWLEGSPAKLLDFDVNAGPDDDKTILVNAALDEGGITLSAVDQGRGVGDCGSASSWAFDGSVFHLVRLTAMTECRGVLPEDWPVLYTASTSPVSAPAPASGN